MAETLLLGELRWLDVSNNIAYLPLPIPCQRDFEISDLIRKLISLTEIEREKSAATLKNDQRSTLLAYSERQASIAVRDQSREALFLGLIALGLDGWLLDWRDNVTILSLFYNSCVRLGANPDQMFKKAASMLSRNVSLAYEAFLRRNNQDKSLEAMGYIESADEDGFRYQRTW